MPGAEFGGGGEVGDELGGVERDAPSVEELAEGGRAVLAAHLHHHRILLLAGGEHVHHAERIDARDETAALDDELVDREERLFGEILGVEDDERLDVGVDGLGGGRDLAHFIVLGKLRERRPAGLRTLALHHHHLVRLLAHHALEGRHEAENRTLRPRDARDEARNVVLERGFGALAEVGEGFLSVAADCDETEVHGLSERSHVLRLDAVALSPFLGVGIRLRIVGLEDDVAVAGEFVLLEEALHLVGVGFDRHGRFGGG